MKRVCVRQMLGSRHHGVVSLTPQRDGYRISPCSREKDVFTQAVEYSAVTLFTNPQAFLAADREASLSPSCISSSGPSSYVN